MLMINNKLTAEQRMWKACSDIVGSNDFVALASVLMVGSKQVVDGLPTACTNGRDELYGREFVDSLTDPEFRFLILHECYHKMYKHLTTWKELHDVDHRRANMACDYVINIKLVDQDDGKGWIKMPKGGLLDAKYRGMSAPEVFKLLPPQEEDEDGEGEGGDGEGFDSHDWEGAKELTDAEKDELSKEIDEAVRQGATLASKTGSGGLRDMGELLQTKQDWRELLRDYVTTSCAGKDYSTWRKPNRRFIGNDIYMPSSISETIDEIAVAIDTSGSIGRHELSMFLTEIKGICDQVKPRRVRIIYWDTEVCKHEVYDNEDIFKIAQSTKPEGGGGTNVECVPMYMAETGVKPDLTVVLTDGYLGGSWGVWSCPVLWCILDNKKAKPDNGTAIHI